MSITRIESFGTCATFLAILSGVPLGCGGPKDEIALVFPSQVAHDATSVIAVTAFEPLAFDPEGGTARLVRCSEIGVFPPTRRIDPDTIASSPSLGRLLSSPRESRPFPFRDTWSLAIPQVKADSATNPWGVVMLYIEARGEAHAEDGGSISATLLAGCYCVRTREATHANRLLDQEVKSACAPLVEGGGKIRDIELEPVLSPAFRLTACGVPELTSPKNQDLSPGPLACLTTTLCSDAPGVGGRDCFQCTQPCDELDDLKNVPLLFTVDQPGGGTEPKIDIVLTSAEGRGRGRFKVDDCASDIKLRAEVLGRPETSLEFGVTCVDPIQEFQCQDETPLVGFGEAVAMTLLPGGKGAVDFIAILYDNSGHASVELRNPLRPTETKTIDYPGEAPRAIRGFSYELGVRPEDDARPALAVVTSKPAGGREGLQVYLYEWVDGNLVSHDGTDRPFARDCPTWACESPMPEDFRRGPDCSVPTRCECQSALPDGRCSGAALPFCAPSSTEACLCGTDPPPPCGCRLSIEFQSEVTMQVADVDGDRRSDLAIATSSDLPITIYRSRDVLTGRGLYRDDGCVCGRFTQAPSTFELLNFGGPAERAEPAVVDLVIGAPGGAFVKYASESQGMSVLSCGQSTRFGGLVPIRDLTRGRFQCQPLSSGGTCEPYEDIVILSARTLGGGGFDDPGSVRVIFGSDKDITLDDRLFDRPGTNVELLPRAFTGRENPRDPRTVEVADINQDGHDDVGVLFAASEEIHVWLGASNKALGEVSQGVVLDQPCLGGGGARQKCTPLRQFVLGDFNGDRAREIAVICDPSGRAALRRYEPVVTR